MGTWGAGPFENDDGADIRNIWERFISGSEETWGAEKVWSFFKDVFFRGTPPVIGDGNANHVIAIAKAFHASELPLPEEPRRLLGSALHHQLSPAALGAWGQEKKKREAALREMAAQNELAVEDLALATASEYADEITSLRRWFENLDMICSVRESVSGEVMNHIESLKPNFGNYIAAQTYDFYDPNDEDGSAELGNLRYMYLVWLVLFDLKRDTQEIVSAVEAIRL